MEHAVAIAETLGGHKVLGRRSAATDTMASQLRSGLPYAALEAVMARFAIGREEAAAILHMPLRTFARRKRAHRLHPGESDRLFRLARIAAQAADVLGSNDRAARWLHRPNRALGNEIPLSLLDTDLGARRVEAVLGRIAHGVFS
jgi:putative toxin-antitoxin system antitoxin component (TIGR02293 family)